MRRRPSVSDCPKTPAQSSKSDHKCAFTRLFGPLRRFCGDHGWWSSYRRSPARLAAQQTAYGGEMMHEFLTANRAELIARCRVKVALRAPPGVPENELAHGVSI